MNARMVTSRTGAQCAEGLLRRLDGTASAMYSSYCNLVTYPRGGSVHTTRWVAQYGERQEGTHRRGRLALPPLCTGVVRGWCAYDTESKRGHTVEEGLHCLSCVQAWRGNGVHDGLDASWIPPHLHRNPSPQQWRHSSGVTMNNGGTTSSL
eukprot:7904546-Pyramimonas_sp.AAC.1